MPVNSKKVMAVIDDIVIEKGVAEPRARTTSGHGYKFPFERMEVGDSFVLPREMTKTLRGSATSANKRLKSQGKRFTVRGVVENAIDMVRCWRVS